MVEVKLPEPDISSGKYTEYSFYDADDFYDALLNFNDTVDKHLKSYCPVIHSQFRWIFRGHWDSNWELLPSAFRQGWYDKFWLGPYNEITLPAKNKRPQPISLKNIEFGKKIQKHIFGEQLVTECALLWRFMTVANSLGIECNYTPSIHTADLQKIIKAWQQYKIEELKKWPDPSIWSLMSIAQHHGIPTRLLDFTYNQFFAAFFAAFYPFEKKIEEISGDAKLCVWAIDERTENDNAWRKIPAPRTRSGNFFAQEGVLITDPKANEKFIKNNNKWQDFQNVGTPNDFVKLTLPQSEYKKLLRRLWESDITPSRIMPNLDKVTQTLEYVKWLWTEE